VAMRAAQLRLDVYSGEARCAGASLAPGAPPPLASKSVAAGQPITVDVPSGRSVLVLTALDAAGALLGSACTEAELGAGSSLCFNLTLAATPDAAMPLSCDGGACACTAVPDSCPAGYYCGGDGNCTAGCKNNGDCAQGAPLCQVAQHRCVECLGPTDCAPGKRCSPGGACVDGCDVAAGSNCPGAIACCANLCVNTALELSSCGACGRACDSSNVATPACVGGLCTSTCVAGRGNCNKPIAPAADDGCETNFYDVMHCGSCTNVCNLASAVASCPSGTCKVQSCTATHFNCDTMDANGCECTGVDLADGMNGCCPAGQCQKLHNNGFAQTFYDCTALGTYTSQLATRAATLFNIAGGTIFNSTCSGNDVVFKRNAAQTECAGWIYNGPAKGYAKHWPTTNCMCPTTADTPWQ
jgi:hypothetical protein